MSSVSIRVTWDEPATPNGIIKEYIISYETSRDYQPSEKTVTGNTMKRVLDGLDKFTTYFIKVRGKTSKMGNASKILNATTFEDSKLQSMASAVFYIIYFVVFVLTQICNRRLSLNHN